MPSYEIEGKLLDSFNTAWETSDSTEVTDKLIPTEVSRALEEILAEHIKPHETYLVSVILTKLENKDAISQREESKNKERVLRERAA